MRKTLFLTIVLFLTSCTQSIDVPTDKYGILFRLGKIENTTLGPSKLQKTVFIESVLLINKTYTVELIEGQYSIKYTVIDPEAYFKEVRGNNSILVLLEKELAKHALSGQSITSKEQLHKIIENMNLPIIIDKNA
ncbi:MAG: hypothetical protein OEZ16_05800 [Chromatiales bacterium]|nr:hypothetical protein [Chromatiales bacterium]